MNQQGWSGWGGPPPPPGAFGGGYPTWGPPPGSMGPYGGGGGGQPADWGWNQYNPGMRPGFPGQVRVISRDRRTLQSIVQSELAIRDTAVV